MHLAESRQELQWLHSGGGPFGDMLEWLGVPDASCPGRNALHYLQALSTTVNALIIHGNYLSSAEMDFIGNQENMHLVYCPRTHQFFGHDRYPLHELLARNINVAVGTDSRASNPDLDLLKELRQIRSSFPDLSPQLILEMGTINGARALEFDDRWGSLTPGKQGEFLAVPLANNKDPLESILDQGQTSSDM